MLRTLPLVRHSIELEINKLKDSNNPEYWGSEENISNENEIFNFVLTYEIVNQEWLDGKLKHTNVELLSELGIKLKQIDESFAN